MVCGTYEANLLGAEMSWVELWRAIQSTYGEQKELGIGRLIVNRGIKRGI